MATFFGRARGTAFGAILIAIDLSGNIYVGGYTGHDAFLSKFDSSGNSLWECIWCDSGNPFSAGTAVYGVVTDSLDNIYVTGVFDATIDFDPGPGVDNRTSNGLGDAFLSKFDSNGNYLWARTWGGVGDDSGGSVATDSSGKVYVAGGFQATVDFDPGSGVDNHTSNGDCDSFLSKFDGSGNFLWARTWGSADDDYAMSVATHSLDAVYLTGKFEDSVDFDPGSGVDSHTSNGITDVFLSKFDPDGNFVWARTWGNFSNDDYLGSEVATDPWGNAYVTGDFQNTVDFDPGPGFDNSHHLMERSTPSSPNSLPTATGKLNPNPL